MNKPENLQNRDPHFEVPFGEIVLNTFKSSQENPAISGLKPENYWHIKFVYFWCIL